MAPRYCLGVIGGSGLYAMDGVDVVGEERPDTPYGDPSDAIVRARTETADLLFLPRHGIGHRIPPHAVNYRANVCALKVLGATHLLGVSAVGSLRGEIAPGHLVAVDQLMDRTERRPRSFFDEPGVVAHIAFADPICPAMHAALLAAARSADGAIAHGRGTLVVIEGPRFSTRAESAAYRWMGADLVGMTAMPEAALAREAELPYALLALVTDYDCGHAGATEAVTSSAVAAALPQMAAIARNAIRALAERLPDPAQSPAHRCLDAALASTDPTTITPEARACLSWLRPFAVSADERSAGAPRDAPAEETYMVGSVVINLDQLPP